MTSVKICGIRSVDEGRVALEAGADWLGFVFWRQSRRFVEPARAREVIRMLREEHSGWSAVGVFVDPDVGEVQRIGELCSLDLVQLSGHEDSASVQAISRPTMKALHVRQGDEANAAQAVLENRLGASLYLLDTHVEGMYGGTGVAFDWEALRGVGPRCFVAGGLTAANVSAALEALQPRGVDVSGGVEFPGGGKDPILVRTFVEAVRRHDLAHAH